jgi:hypothetical protein
MDKAQGPVLLLDAEPPRAVGGVRVFINTCSALLFEEADDLIEDAGRDGNITVSLQNMLDNGDFNWREILIAKATFLLLRSRKCQLIGFEHVLCKLELLRP